MTDQQEVDRLIEVATDLDPRAVSAEVSFLTGARLKAWNAEGSTRHAVGGAPALPLPDYLDRWCQRKHKQYRANIRRARKLLEDCLFIQGELLVRMHDENGAPSDEARQLAAEMVSPQADECANCHRIVERTATDKLLGGRCRPCHRYLKEHGVERPESLWLAVAA